MMAEEKAQELFDKMLGKCASDNGEQTLILSKQCAVIAVDEIISEIKSIVFNYGMDDSNSDTSPTYTIIPYWERVKEAINNL